MHFRLGSARVDVEVVKIFIAVGVEVVVLALGIVVLFWLLDSVLCILAFYFLFLYFLMMPLCFPLLPSKC